jgi:glucose/arabinose dehydrogenase
MRPHRILLALFAVTALFFVPTLVGAGVSNVVKVPTGFVDDSLVGGFALPRAFAFLPDGRMLVIEHKTARIRLVVGNHIASTDPILTVSNVNNTGYERGTQGIAIDPGWPARPYVYVFHNGADGFNHLIRYTASGNISNPTAESIVLGEKREIISNIPDVDANHQAGCIRFGNDGMLFVALGEDEQWCAAQDSTSLRGSILRINVNNVPAGPGAQPLRSLLVPAATVHARLQRRWSAHGFRNPWTF